MNVVALRSLSPDSRQVLAVDSRIARLEVFDDLDAAEPHWRALEHGQTLATPYQRYDFLCLWQRHVGQARGITPFIVVAFNTVGTPLFLWPFGLRKLAGLRVVEFLGGKYANFNLGLWRREIAAKISADDLRAALGHLAGRADIVKLINQPLTWADTTNPFALLPRQRSANFGVTGPLVPNFEALLYARTNSATRKKMRKKERTLASYGAVRFARMNGATEVRRALDAFFKQKSVCKRTMGVPDVYGAPDVRRFIEAAATEHSDDGKPPIELYALSVDDIIVATMGGIVGGGHFCGVFGSIVRDRFALESLGEQLNVHLVRSCCERGLDACDLGIVGVHCKQLFCSDPVPLFDSYLPLSAVGRVLAATFAIAAAIKRTIKEHTVLWSMVCALRRLRAWLSVAP